MKNKISILLTAFFCSVLCFADSPSDTKAMTEEEAFQVLKNADSFGFGSKKGQKARKTDTAYKLLLAASKPKELFKKLFKEGNVNSKLYALCMLWHLDKKEFQELIKEVDEKEKVHTQFGCVIDEETVGEIITDIRNDKYEYEFIKFKLSSKFKYRDGRVSERDFNVVLKLYITGTVSGHYESWLEARLTDGTSKLVFFDEKVKGKWVLKDNELKITIFAYSLPDFKFKEFNGMKIKIIREKPTKSKPPQQ